MHVPAVKAQRIPPATTAAWPIPRSLAIMSPGYFPDVRSAAYLLAAECVVVADVVQYSRQSQQNRCRIRTPDGAHWLTVPLRGGQHGAAHRHVEVDVASPWPTRHRKAFEFNYRSSPYFDFYDSLVWDVLDRPVSYLADVTTRSIAATAKLLGVEKEVNAASEVVGSGARAACRPASQADDTGSGEPVSWSRLVLSLASAYPDADVLLMEPWVRETIGKEWRAIRSIDVRRLDYEQNFPGHVSGLSMLDLIFNVGPEARRLVEAAMKLAD